MVRITVREYRPEDAHQVAEVFRDSMRGLSRSAGGLHSDEHISRLVGNPDNVILQHFASGSILFVAEAEPPAEIVGISGFTYTMLNRLAKVTQRGSLFVKHSYQRGKNGVNVGSALMDATHKKLASMGFRKVYLYATPESVGFYRRFGARFFPSHDHSIAHGSPPGRYCEIALRESFLNEIRVEPYFFKVMYYVSLLRESVGRRLRNR